MESLVEYVRADPLAAGVYAAAGVMVAMSAAWCVQAGVAAWIIFKARLLR